MCSIYLTKMLSYQNFIDPLKEFACLSTRYIVMRSDQLPVVSTIANLVHLVMKVYFSIFPSNSDYHRYLCKKNLSEIAAHSLPLTGPLLSLYRLFQKNNQLLPINPSEPALEDSEEVMIELLSETKDPATFKRASLRLKNDKQFVLRAHQELLDLDLLKYVGDQIKQEVIDDLFLETFPDFVPFMPSTIQEKHNNYKRASMGAKLLKELRENFPKLQEHVQAEAQFQEGFSRVTRDLEDLVGV